MGYPNEQFYDLITSELCVYHSGVCGLTMTVGTGRSKRRYSAKYANTTYGIGYAFPCHPELINFVEMS